MTPEPFFEEIPHTADWALRIWGANMPELFAHAAQAMFLRMGIDPDRPPTVSHTVTLNDCGPFEVLLVSWLNELLFLSEDNEEIYSQFEMAELTNEHLQATVRGYAGRPAGIKIKAATFYDVHIDPLPGQVVTTLTFDV